MTEVKEPGFMQMVRAPFFSSIISPLLAGTLIAVAVQQSFNVTAWVLVMIMGFALHAATNVYNDIYDTLQGTDRVNVNRNAFSGGSGILVNYPHLQNKMFMIARSSLLIALFSTAGLMFYVNRSLWPFLWLLYLLAAFFSKYYTAAPFSLAGRGWGEISVWFAFGPMAMLVAAVSQSVGFHPYVIALMPVTGISTLSILLIGQLIDLPADEKTGKHGVAVRLGSRFTAFLYAGVQLLLVIVTLTAALFVIPGGWVLMLSLIPYALFLPDTIRQTIRYHDDPARLKQAAGLNVRMHLMYSLLLSVSLGLYLLIRF